MVFNRIMIIGLPGAGKSTFALKLASMLNIPCYHIDQFYWKPGWKKHPPEAWAKIHTDLISKDSWIIEGCAIKSSFMQRFARADVVIYFKVSRIVCLYRMVVRKFFLKRPDSLPSGCYEGLPLRLIRYMWTFDSVLMKSFLVQARLECPLKKIIVVRNNQEMRELFDYFLRQNCFK